MIHNPRVNDDLRSLGIRFLRTTQGEELFPFSELTPEDVVIIPAFGTSLETADELDALGIDTKTYDTTCPFVEKVWKRSAQIGSKGFTVVVHGKRFHEETRATFSHADRETAVVVVRDIREARVLADVITGALPAEEFYARFDNRYSNGFDPLRDLERIGVVNQTTMLASETADIASVLKRAVEKRSADSGEESRFADTSDTLCYATNENQDAALALVAERADLAVVVGGANSSNTGHLVEICGQRMPTYFVSDAQQIRGPEAIDHFDLESREAKTMRNWLPETRPVRLLLTAGASCPDILLDEVIRNVSACFEDARPFEDVVTEFSIHSPSRPVP